MFKRIKQFIITPMVHANKVSKVLLLIFIIINGIVLYNTIFHHSGNGYDSKAHIQYFKSLAEFRLPTPEDSYQFFSPPLYYVIPALVKILASFFDLGKDVDLGIAAKFAQFINLFLSLGLTVYILKISELIKPGNIPFKAMSLGFLGMMPGYYKVFTFVKPDALLAFLTVLLVYQTILIFFKDEYTKKRIILYGLTTGALLLARQWGFFVLLSLGIFILILMLKKREYRLKMFKTFTLSSVMGLILASWFYTHLYLEYGSFSHFNRPPASSFSFSNQPKSFYCGLSLKKLITDPIDGPNSYHNQFIPIFYSEFWGDYWRLFNVCYIDTRKNILSNEYGGFLERGMGLTKIYPQPWWLKTNRYEINTYLGRVNAVSIFASILFLCAVFMGLSILIKVVRQWSLYDYFLTVNSLFFLIILINMSGYFWFILMFPNPDGDTIKASYMIHIFPFIGFLTAELCLIIREKSNKLYLGVLLVMILTFFHNYIVYFSQYNILKVLP